MKLLELTRMYYPSVGGMERFVHERTKIYEQLGIEYAILTTTFATEKADHAVPVKNVVRLKYFSPYNIVPGIFRRLGDEYDYVSVNLLGRFYSDVSIFHYGHRRQKVILTPYFAFHTDKRFFVKRMVEKYLFPRLLSKIDALIVFSECEKKFWMDRFHVPERTIFVIPPYIAEECEASSAGERNSAEKYFLYVGRAGANKLTDVLLKAFVRAEDLPIHLYLTIRPIDVETGIREAVLNHPRIKLLGYVSEADKRALIAHAEALVFPTSWESFGYVAFEASALRKPLLCSDIPVLRELHDAAGVLFFPNDEQGMADAMAAFLSRDDAQKNEMGRINYANSRRLSFETTCAKYAAMFSAIGQP